VRALKQDLLAVKAASQALTSLDEATCRAVLRHLAKAIVQSSEQIIKTNQLDLAAMSKDDPKYDRLLLSKDRIAAMAEAIELIADLDYPLHQVIEERRRPNGLQIQKLRVPLGVVAVIYESRPNVTMDVFALCFKTGNACILKGGKEANHSNQILVSLIHESLQSQGINTKVAYLLPLIPKATDVLLKANRIVDVCIPRGSQALIDYVREKAQIPIIETGAGIVHTYFDASGDKDKGRLVVNNAKTRRVSVCNALDTLIMHAKRLDDLPHIVGLLAAKEVIIYADDLSYKALKQHYPAKYLHHAKADDFGREFLSYKMAIKTVPSLEAALQHIQQHTSGHSESIIAEDKKAISLFLNQVDAAALYVNASTAFTDGGQFGMGAEIGISTQKLHARGPMALEALSSYKWLVFGEGHIRPD
jgi:glutamate-5-semialdehyde dehydrogenase